MTRDKIIKHKANLRNANLSDAYLRGADLSSADLRGADLNGADLSGAVGYIVGPQRSDSYRFDLRIIDGSWSVVAGCNTGKNWTTAQYRAHAAKYSDEGKRAETLAILDYLDVRAAMMKTTEAKR